MVAEIIQLHPSQLVEQLEQALEQARSGECTGFALVASMDNGETLVCTGIKGIAFERVHYEIGRISHTLHRLADAMDAADRAE